ncbi:MAG: hypothetical protein BMS9Abin29_2293 [Gemmatimonadota bacterium]|nr:MAG: hypothetical protein BMS9Abin29_2293 [Gemmatimonadota bacterium]
MTFAARIVLLASVLAVAGARSGLAQTDVEALAAIYGTTVPDGYYEVLRANPAAFRFQRGFRSLPRAGERAGLSNQLDGPALGLGPRPVPALGTFRFPVILGLYSDSDPLLGEAPFTRDAVQAHFFDGPNLQGLSIAEYYAEISGGRAVLVGETQDWVKTSLSAADVTGNANGLNSTGDVTGFILEILGVVDDGSIDWGTYDNDGPDGVANSGDDDGFVDVLSVVHPTAGAECTSNALNVWSHLWSLLDRSGVTYTTTSPSANGGQIVVNDYTITPARSCNQVTINEIGVFSHELGHGFGLPDLYAVGGQHAGIGQWGLMGTGNFGCNQGAINSARPCHMSAWSKEALGWADIEVLAPGVDHGVLTLDPVETGGKIYRVAANDASGDYYLLENRQRLGSDIDLPSPGLLIWRIDPAMAVGQWSVNLVNSDKNRMGVWLQQADGENDLGQAGRGRGDPGDPFPGATSNQVFHAGSSPASVTHEGATAGVTVTEITTVGQQIEFRLLTRFQSVTVRSVGTAGGGSLFTIDGVPQVADPFVFQSAPFQAHSIEAAGGEPPVNGVRNAFSSWDDASPRSRDWVTGTSDGVLIASYGTPEVQFDVELVTPSQGVSPGSIVKSPSSDPGWILLGAPVSVLADARTGFAFDSWTGALAGMPNPAVVTLSTPTTSAAIFGLTYGFGEGTPSELILNAVDPVDVTFEVVNGNAPVRWIAQGTFPTGLGFDTGTGRLSGIPIVDGDFPVTLRAIDAIGLQAVLDLTIRIGPPAATLQDMAAPFLLGGEIDPNLALFLDGKGNQDGTYDLGDFRAYVLATPPGAVLLRAPGPVEAVIPVTLAKDGGVR